MCDKSAFRKPEPPEDKPHTAEELLEILKKKQRENKPFGSDD